MGIGVIEEGVKVTELLFIYIADNNSLVHIGKNTTFGETAISVADNENFVIIGEDCMFARNVRILASDFHAIIELETGKRKKFFKRDNNSKSCLGRIWCSDSKKFLCVC